jgi:hypothetical protein
MMMVFFTRGKRGLYSGSDRLQSVAGAIATDDDDFSTTKHHATMTGVL